MTTLNKSYLSEISTKYKIEDVDLFGSDFSSYVLTVKRDRIYLALCNDYSCSYDVNKILEEVSVLEEKSKKGNSYLCVMAADNPTKEMCTFFNGKSFVHFILIDNNAKNLVYDKKIYYSGVKHIKKLMDMYQKCFDELMEV